MNVYKENIVNHQPIQAANSARPSQVPGQVLTLVKDVQSPDQAPTLFQESLRPDQLKTPIKIDKTTIKLEPKVSFITFLALSHVAF